ncbi:MAG TPA: hypothetical protein DF610_11735 [Sphingobacterium sp.]|nr:hypothetical protein FM120_11230 [Sphingobacterium faecium PCAi_F2.5]HCU45430.1 hypothetical protein [Sphingobacterium sp.]
MTKQQIIAKVAEVLGFSVDELLTKGRKTDVVYARYITMSILRVEGFSDNDIADVFTQWTLNNIANHCREVFDSLISYNRKFKDMYLKAAKAVEDLDDEIQNEKKSA